ncbi:DNA alkylation repair protein [Bacillus sp. JCM 19041]|uniref:DNA alkylation repair protein n=1 Tax=Bacillus sp. JCM 19041 TaxID=1460637 RepID=UPI0006D25E77
MAEPLKQMYNQHFLETFAARVKAVHDSFDEKSFVEEVMDNRWEEMELKARTRRIAETLGSFLPTAFPNALAVLYKVDREGLKYLFIPDFVEVYGQAAEDWEEAVEGLKRFTPYSSSEFAIRSFILKEPKKMMSIMKEWALDEDEHVRRLASEGCRPRLPWGQSLPVFKKDPSLVLEILELLKADPSLYVRKSVANNLNDISKDHPDTVLEIAKRWKSEGNGFTDWIVRRGCRTLVKQANPYALALFGYSDMIVGEPLIDGAFIQVDPSEVHIGGASTLRFGFRVIAKESVTLRIEYAIDFVKARGKTGKKAFLLSDKTFRAGAVVDAERTHRFEDLSTRRHYAGVHLIRLVVNGVEVASTTLNLMENN